MTTSTRIHTPDEINAMSDAERKVLENRLRHAARRQGLWLVKSRRRDRRAVDYGLYALLDPRTRFPVTNVADPLGTGYPLDLYDVKQYLFGEQS
ncbi:hypothetical protein ACRU3B_18175 [Mycobacterium colombiense]